MGNKFKSVRMERYQELLRKERYYDVVLSAENGMTSSEIAAEMGHTAQWLHKQLEEKGIIKKVNDCWFLTPKYADGGYMQTRTMIYTDDEMNFKTKLVGTWTQKGRVLIYQTILGEDTL